MLKPEQACGHIEVLASSFCFSVIFRMEHFIVGHLRVDICRPNNSMSQLYPSLMSKLSSINLDIIKTKKLDLNLLFAFVL